MASERQSQASPAGHVRRGLARAFGAALIFAVPMLMTEELWNLGAAMDQPTPSDGTLIGDSFLAGELLLEPPTGCPTDFDGSGGPQTVADIFAYLSAFFAAGPAVGVGLLLFGAGMVAGGFLRPVGRELAAGARDGSEQAG